MGEEHKKRKAVVSDKKMDYKSIMVLSLLKIFKKLKAFTIRKYLRQLKYLETGDEKNVQNVKEPKEVIEKRVAALKELKNPCIKVMIPFFLVDEFDEDLERYWPVFEKNVAALHPERRVAGCTQRIRLRVPAPGSGRRSRAQEPRQAHDLRRGTLL